MSWLWLLLACTSPETPAPVSAPAPPIDQVPLCNPDAEVLSAGHSVQIALFHHDSVPSERARALVDEASVFWQRWGVSVEVEGPTSVDLPAPLGGTPDQIDALLRAKGIDPDQRGLDDDVAAELVSRLVFAQVRYFLRTRAPRDPGVILVVVSPRMAERGSPAEGAFDHLGGMTLGAPGASLELKQAVGVVPPNPAVFVGLDALPARGPGWPGTLAHELGHAMGLGHHDDPGNLMAPMPAGCLPHLEFKQIAQLRGPP